MVVCVAQCACQCSQGWVRACAKLYTQAFTHIPPGGNSPLLKRALLADLQLTLSLPASKSRKTWSGGWLRTLGWLAVGGGEHGAVVTQHLADVRHAAAEATASGGWPPGRVCDTLATNTV